MPMLFSPLRTRLAMTVLLASIGVAPFFAVHAAGQEEPEPQTSANMREPVREDLSFKVGKDVPIDVINAYGDVRVRFGGYENELGLHTTLQQPEGAKAITIKPVMREGRYVVEPVLPAGAELAEGQRMDLVAYVPQGHALRVRTVYGTIDSRNTKSDVELRSQTGNVTIRGNEGMASAHSDEGNVTVLLSVPARAGATQNFTSRTGRVSVEVMDALNSEVTLSTSSLLSTDYSVQIEHRDGEEPNKRARAVVGTPMEGKEKAMMSIDSLVGEVRLLRRAVFVDPE